jgi:hypothetical protein
VASINARRKPHCRTQTFIKATTDDVAYFESRFHYRGNAYLNQDPKNQLFGYV